MRLSLEVGESIQLGTCFTVFQSCYRSWAWCLIPEMFKKLPQIGARDVVTPGSVPYICICKHYYEEPVFFFCAMPIHWWMVEIFSVELNNATAEVGSDLCP